MRLSRAAGIAVTAVGALALVGWILDVAAPKSVLAGLATMKFNTALAVALAGTSLRLQHSAARWQAAARACAIGVLLVGASTSLEYLLDRDLGIDQLLVADPATTSAPPGRMSPASALGLALTGAALWLSSRGHARAATGLALLVTPLAFLAVLGYAFGAPALYAIGPYSSMALHTAGSLLLLGLGTLFLRPLRGPVAIFSLDSAGGVAARRLLPTAIGLLVLLGWLRLQGEGAGWYGPATGVAVFVFAASTLLGALIVGHAWELHRADLERARTQERYQQLYDEAPDMFATIDAHSGRIVECNETLASTLGYAKHELVGRVVFDLYHPDDRERARGTLDVFVEEGRLPDAERRFLRSDGSIIDVVLTAAAVRDEHGRVRYSQSVWRDVTDRKRLAEAQRRADALEAESRHAREASRLKSDFLANMSHELRTPLNAITGFAQLLHDGRAGTPSPEQKEYLADILASSRHLLRLIEDVLDLARVESGKIDLRPQRVVPAQAVLEVRDVLRSVVAEKRVALGSEIDPLLTEVSVDPARLKQVLYNYVSNALKFTPEGGRIVVRVRVEDADRFRVEVEDDGVGIRPEDMGRLFRQFQQLDESAAKRHAGTGLGLALTRSIVEAQGGYVGARSAPGQGSLFFAVLPRAASATDAAAPEASRAARPPDRRPGAPTVLVVEDDAKDRDWLARTLVGAGYGVETARSGAEALARCGGRSFDAITLDILLPDMTGWDVLRRLHNARCHGQARVIVVTVVPQKAAAEFPIHDVLLKPLEAASLLASLARGGILPVPGAGGGSP